MSGKPTNQLEQLKKQYAEAVILAGLREVMRQYHEKTFERINQSTAHAKVSEELPSELSGLLYTEGKPQGRGGGFTYLHVRSDELLENLFAALKNTKLANQDYPALFETVDDLRKALEGPNSLMHKALNGTSLNPSGLSAMEVRDYTFNLAQATLDALKIFSDETTIIEASQQVSKSLAEHQLAEEKRKDITEAAKIVDSGTYGWGRGAWSGSSVYIVGSVFNDLNQENSGLSEALQRFVDDKYKAVFDNETVQSAIEKLKNDTQLSQEESVALQNLPTEIAKVRDDAVMALAPTLEGDYGATSGRGVNSQANSMAYYLVEQRTVSCFAAGTSARDFDFLAQQNYNDTNFPEAVNEELGEKFKTDLNFKDAQAVNEQVPLVLRTGGLVANDASSLQKKESDIYQEVVSDEMRYQQQVNADYQAFSGMDGLCDLANAGEFLEKVNKALGLGECDPKCEVGTEQYLNHVVAVALSAADDSTPLGKVLKEGGVSDVQVKDLTSWLKDAAKDAFEKRYAGQWKGLEDPALTAEKNELWSKLVTEQGDAIKERYGIDPGSVAQLKVYNEAAAGNAPGAGVGADGAQAGGNDPNAATNDPALPNEPEKLAAGDLKSVFDAVAAVMHGAGITTGSEVPNSYACAARRSQSSTIG